MLSELANSLDMTPDSYDVRPVKYLSPGGVADVPCWYGRMQSGLLSRVRQFHRYRAVNHYKSATVNVDTIVRMSVEEKDEVQGTYPMGMISARG